MKALTPAPRGLYLAWRGDEDEGEWCAPVVFVVPGEEANTFEPVCVLDGRIQLARVALPGGFEVRVDLEVFALGEAE